MPHPSRELTAPTGADVGFVVLSLACILLIIPLKFFSWMPFEATGTLHHLPDIVVLGIVPAALAALLPIAIANRLYVRHIVLFVTTVTLVVYCAVSIYLMPFWTI